MQTPGIILASSTAVRSLRLALESLEEKMKSAVEMQGAVIGKLHPAQKTSAGNLIRYLALRKEDMRPLQDALHIAYQQRIAYPSAVAGHNGKTWKTNDGRSFGL